MVRAAPSVVDLQFITHVERMLASLLYWKNLKLRGTGSFAGLDAWLTAFEQRPSYIATKSDYYTHVMVRCICGLGRRGLPSPLPLCPHRSCH